MSSSVAARTHRTTRTGSRLDSTRRHRSSSGRAGRPLGAVEIAVLVAIALLLLVGTLVDRQGTAAPQTPTRKVQVSAGQTLWSIAQAHPMPGYSTAQTADHIAATNGLSGDALAIGQTIEVPALGESVTDVALR